MVGSRHDRKRSRPNRVELATEELFIQWMDGTESRLSLVDLRRACPCAVCRHAREQSDTSASGELTMLTGEIATATGEASGFVNVGRYGIRISWADGHDTGIYTFESLRDSS